MFYSFVSGSIVSVFGLISLFFLRFWSRTRERLFLEFASAFLLLALNQALLALASFPAEERSVFFLIRLMAFGIIIFAVIEKNQRQ